MIAVGVARPRAQGQAMIRTATKLSRAMVSAGAGPKSNQTTKVSRAIAEHDRDEDAGDPVGQPLDGRLGPLGFAHQGTIWASTVSLPTRVAWNSKLPVLFIVPPMTGLARLLGHRHALAGDHGLVHGRLAARGRRRPREGVSPGRTTRMSPTATSSMGISISP